MFNRGTEEHHTAGKSMKRNGLTTFVFFAFGATFALFFGGPSFWNDVRQLLGERRLQVAYTAKEVSILLIAVSAVNARDFAGGVLIGVLIVHCNVERDKVVIRIVRDSLPLACSRAGDEECSSHGCEAGVC